MTIRKATTLVLVFASFFIVLFLYRLGRPHIFVSPDGDDRESGTKTQPVQSINRAYAMATAGSTIHILPGIYRESVLLAKKRLTLRAQNSNTGQAVIAGSDPSSGLVWSQCTRRICPLIQRTIRHHVYVATLNWEEKPTVVVETTSDGIEHRLPLARAPNYHVADQNKYHEHWWLADGQSTSQSSLTDTGSDEGLEQGNLKIVADLTGGAAYIMDGQDQCGTFLYYRSVKGHDRNTGTILLGGPVGAAMWGYQENGIGPYTKYFVENAVGLLDTPGEWFYDERDTNLYLWPLANENPGALSVEIGRRSQSVRIGASNVTVDGVMIKNTNDHTDRVGETGAISIIPPEGDTIKNIRLSRISTSNVGTAIYLATDSTSTIENVVIRDAHIRASSKSAIYVEGNEKTPPSIQRVRISGSEISFSGFRFNDPAIHIIRASDVNVSGNTVGNSASYGIHLTSYNTKPGITKNILVKDNTVHHACQNASGCSALKFFGGRFEHAIAQKNILRDNQGWSYCVEQKEGRRGSAQGLFISNAGGVTVRNNASYRNSDAAYSAFTRQVPTTNNTFTRNLAAFSRVGLALVGGDMPNTNPVAKASRHDHTVIKRNVFMENTTALVLDPAHPDYVRIDYNTYRNNQILMLFQGKPMETLSAITSTFPLWEKHAKEAAP